MECRTRNKLAAQAVSLQTNVRHIWLTRLFITIAITLLLHLLLHLPSLLHLLLHLPLLLLLHLLLLLLLQLSTNNRNKITLQGNITVLKQYISQAIIWEDKERIWTEDGQLEIWTAISKTTRSQNTTEKVIASLKKILNSRWTSKPK